MKWITYKTRKQLKEEISNLKSQLQRANERATITSRENLPPCKSLACVNCQHIAYYRAADGIIFTYGCGKDHQCPDFEQKTDILTEHEKEALKWYISNFCSDNRDNQAIREAGDGNGITC